MRGLSLGLGLGLTRIFGPSGFDYSENGFDPDLVLDYGRDYFRVGGVQVSDPVEYGALGLASQIDNTGIPIWNVKDGGGNWIPVGDTLPGSPVYLPRTYHHVWNGGEWVGPELLSEPVQRTNLLLNNPTLSTQVVTTTAVAHTLHFTGTGTITLTGTSTAGPLVGTGTGEENRVILPFTPGAGALTCTVSGTVTNAQLEVGETAGSLIPTADSTVTRAADPIPQMAAVDTPAGAGMPAAVSIAHKGRMTYADEDVDPQLRLTSWEFDTSNFIRNTIYSTAGTGEYYSIQNNAGSTDVVVSSSSIYVPGQNVFFNIASRHGATFINAAHEGTALTADLTPTALADLSAAPFQFAHTGDQILTDTLRVWGENLGDVGLETATAIPVVTSATYDDPTTTLDIGITEASGSVTVYWALVTNPSTPDKKQVRAASGGGILEADSYTANTGANSNTIVVTDVLGDEIHLFAENTATDRSDPITIITGVVVS